MNFANKHYEKLLAKAITGDRLAHAIIFYGPPSSNKCDSALLLATSYLCSNQGESRSLPGCLQCNDCKQVLNKNHANLFIVNSSQDNKANAASELKNNKILISHIKEIKYEIGHTPYQNKKRFFILANAENMTINAANALLKILEEPHKNNHFIITSLAPMHVPLTIRSRCQYIFFTSPQQTLTQKQIIETLKDLNISSINKRLEIIKKISTTKENIITYVENLAWAFTQLAKQYDQINVHKITISIRSINQTLNDLSMNANVNLLLENLLLKGIPANFMAIKY